MTDKAILFGINDYRSISDLRGCENDLEDVRKLLVGTYGFNHDNVKTFPNKAVVKSAIEDGFDWLSEGSKPGDRLVFHFSGHGSYTKSKSNDKDVDELICLYGMDWDDEDTFIRDTDLGRLANKVDSGAQLTILLDSCHSGSGTRGVTSNLRAAARVTSKTGLVIIQDTANQLAKHRGAVEDHAAGIEKARAGTMRALRQEATPPVYARFVEPPVAIQQIMQKRRAVKVRALGESMRATLNHQLLAAAHEKQTAADAFIDGDYHGAFSFYLCETARSNTRSSVASIMKETSERIKTAGYGQDPQIDGPFGSELLFGGLSSSPASDDVVPPMPSTDWKDTNQSVAEVEATHSPCVDSGTGLTGSSGPLDTLNHLLRVSEKLIDLARSTSIPVAAVDESERGVRDEVIVYVHGINEHLPGYSRAWHSSITPHLRHSIRRAEVRWSQHVNSRAVAESAAARIGMETFQKEIEDELERRIARMEEVAAQRSSAGRSRSSAAIRIERPRSFLLDDFTRYMLVTATRELIINEFTSIVVPELIAGRKVHIVSHSWGTVVAYEGMRRLDPRSFPGRVENLFVAGSALSIGAVQSNLFGRVDDGRAPAHIDRVINLDAGGDIIGGPIGDAFTVDREFLGLDPTGCRKIPFTGIAFNPVCAHGSYFVPENMAVNRDIFAAMINQT